MTMTLEVPKELESRIRDRAAEQGVDLNTWMVRLLAENSASRHPPSADPAAALTARESELLGQINLGFSASFWSRYHLLTDRLEAESLSSADHAEFLSLVAQVEDANARRLEAVAELAAARGVPFDDLWNQLGLGQTNRATAGGQP